MIKLAVERLRLSRKMNKYKIKRIVKRNLNRRAKLLGFGKSNEQKLVEEMGKFNNKYLNDMQKDFIKLINLGDAISSDLGAEMERMNMSLKLNFYNPFENIHNQLYNDLAEKQRLERQQRRG